MNMPSILPLLEQGLHAASLRQQAISNNIANVDTPHYKAQTVTFEAELQKALQQDDSSFTAYRTNPKHITFGVSDPLNVEPVLQQENTVGPMQNSDNNVDLDSEMSNLAKNQIWYNALVQQTSGQFSKLRMAIEGR
ncbi:flagellar basal body rod protein FlgB [Aneurinibacillus sp. Ricciae_BoGa-3]|uniref:flagellar basal body rod protein FlgB n=1 Tax=Aneurinibacillus sp. Ricciae_BoGa-3 TaxID=3022697 RepID=UPI0023405296|nr:flagellar basal body rod protein FlgB [Aneurinibacillus sp. Ricciae_BoGa-3]WCK52904.1 flagellar basal body rod protein FlgB [Aneurinibacillus sp. Ricciae_BoGa-3]